MQIENKCIILILYFPVLIGSFLVVRPSVTLRKVYVVVFPLVGSRVVETNGTRW